MKKRYLILCEESSQNRILMSGQEDVFDYLKMCAHSFATSGFADVRLIESDYETSNNNCSLDADDNLIYNIAPTDKLIEFAR